MNDQKTVEAEAPEGLIDWLASRTQGSSAKSIVAHLAALGMA